LATGRNSANDGEICELEAKDAPSAIKRVIREYGIDDPHRRKRLTAYRVV
jgi:hypothetical protein